MRGIFANRWWVVVATVLALIVGAGPINVFSFGVFLKPITAELGIGRGTFSAALTAHSTIGALSCPVMGWMIDRCLALLMSQAGGAAPFCRCDLLRPRHRRRDRLMAFFADRYFGLRNYAKIYGTMFGLFGLGVGIGPTLSGFSFDRFHSYTPIFAVYEIMLFATCIIFLRLGTPIRQAGMRRRARR